VRYVVGILSLVLPLLSGCASPSLASCLSLAPPGDWNGIEKPNRSVAVRFKTPEFDSEAIWFKNEKGYIGVCNSCEGIIRQAASFETVNEITVRTCGPY